MRSLIKSVIFASEHEKTLYNSTDKMNSFSTYVAQSSNEANSGCFMRHPVKGIHQKIGTNQTANPNFVNRLTTLDSQLQCFLFNGQLL